MELSDGDLSDGGVDTWRNWRIEDLSDEEAVGSAIFIELPVAAPIFEPEYLPNDLVYEDSSACSTIFFLRFVIETMERSGLTRRHGRA